MSIIKLPPYMLDSTLEYTFQQVTSTGNLVVQGNLVFADGTSQTTAGAGGNAGNVISNSSVYISSTGGDTNWVIDTDNALTIPRLGSINFVDPEIGGFGTPSASSRTAGTRIVLYPQVTGSTTDYAIGIDGGVQWYGVPDSNARFDWYAAETQIATLSGSGTFTANGNVKAQNFQFANGVNILSTVGAGSYGNADVEAYLAANSAIPITTLANITTVTNVIASKFLFTNGVNILSTVSGGSYANADVAAYLAANSAIYLGNPATRPALQANVTQTFVGNTTTIGAGSNQLGGTYILNNAYFGANGAMYAKNTQTGAAQFSISGGSFSWAGTTGAVTAGAVQSFGLWATLSSTGFATQNSINITSAGSLTAAAGLILNSNASIVTNQSTASIFNTTATTINFVGAATTITTGASSANLVVGTSAGLGNVFARNFNGIHYGNAIGTTATYSGNVTANTLTVGSNITVGNLITTGTYGNITGANVISANTVIVGNVQITGASSNVATNYPVFYNTTTNQLSRSIKPVASAYYTGSSTSFSWGAVFKPDTVDLNVSSMYDSSTGSFTPTVPGWYRFTPIMWISSATSGWYVQVAKNNWPSASGPGNVSIIYGDSTVSGSSTYNGSAMVYLNGTTDYAKVYVLAGTFGSGDTVTIQGSGFFDAKITSVMCEWVSP